MVVQEVCWLFFDTDHFIHNKVIISNCCVAVEGVWLVSSMDVLLISFYAPQRADCKKATWGGGDFHLDCFFLRRISGDGRFQ